jgi:DNA polymerase-3 subunit epsilon
MLEMLSQARAISFDVAPTALEAALLEPDEIKRLEPPYNIALNLEDRAVWFAPPDLSERSPRPSSRCPLGPFASAEAIDQFAALAQASPAALGRGRWSPDAAAFNAGYTRFCAAHGELWRDDLSAHVRLLRLGTRLWREGRRDHDVDEQGTIDIGSRIAAWTPEQVLVSLEWISLRAALVRRRARWLTRLVDASVVWSEPGVSNARLLVIENGEIATRDAARPGMAPPIPPGYPRPTAARREGFTIARFDRLRVLTTEIKRLVSAGAPVAVRFGGAPALTGARLARALSWL